MAFDAEGVGGMRKARLLQISVNQKVDFVATETHVVVVFVVVQLLLCWCCCYVVVVMLSLLLSLLKLISPGVFIYTS